MQALAKLKLSATERHLHYALIFPKGVDSRHSTYSSVAEDAAKVVKMINDHPFFARLDPALTRIIPPARLSAPLVDEILSELFAAHSNGVKALDFFNHCLRHSPAAVTPYAFDKTLHILVRMHYLDRAWELLEAVGRLDPSLLTVRSMSLVLMKAAESGSCRAVVDLFGRMERGAFSDRAFGTEEFNALLLAFCSRRRMEEARAVFHAFRRRFPADTKTVNILLLGFRRSGDVASVELFHHEAVRRGFAPNAVTYNIRIDALCKRRELQRALALFREMGGRRGCAPTVETIATLVHGFGIAGEVSRSREVFDETRRGGPRPDAAVYNALISSVIRGRDVGSAAGLMAEMEGEGVGPDGTTYHTMLFGLTRAGAKRAVREVFGRMVRRDVVPGSRTVVMTTRFLCRNREVGWGLGLWRYLIQKGHCPHANALHLLVMSLCARGRTGDAFTCSRQLLERGRCIAPPTCRLLETFLARAGAPERWKVLEEGVKRLRAVLPVNPAGKPSHHSSSDFLNGG